MAANQDARALDLDVQDDQKGKISVQLKALSKDSQQVSYELETVGSSRSVHRGKTTLSANEPAILSTMNFSYQDDWCVTLNVEEENAPSYQIKQGSSCG